MTKIQALLIELVILLFTAAACAQGEPPKAEPTPEPFDRTAFAWLVESNESPSVTRLDEHYPPPPGATRIPVDEQAFGNWLRGLPVRLDRKEVRSHSGRVIAAPADAVILLDVGSDDLQQCADTIIRLHAEFLWSSGHASEAAYYFTSGDLSSWKDWLGGELFVPDGALVRRRQGAPRSSDHATYRSWLQHLFIYAGTMSLGLDSVPISAKEPILPGDFFVSPGSPGHAVIVLDVAVLADGTRVGLIGQGFTPAQELHVLRDGTAIEGVWFPLPAVESDSLRIPSWSPFPRSSARRFTR